MYWLLTAGICLLHGITVGSNDITASVFGEGGASIDVFPVAFTDYDGDKRTDLIVLTKNFSSFRIYFGSAATPSLQFLPQFQCDVAFSQNFKIISGIITGLNVADFTGDGVNDILVAYKYSSDDSSDVTYVSIVKGDLKSLNCELLTLGKDTANNTRLPLRREPLIVDINGDMIADLVGETANGDRKIWTFRRDLSPPSESPFPCNGSCFQIDTGGFVDIDGDFIPDLVLITDTRNKSVNNATATHQVEIYDTFLMKGVYGEFKIRQRFDIDFPIGYMGSALFLDMGLTGLDHSIVLPFCSDKDCQTSGFALVDTVASKVYKLDVAFTDSTGSHWSFLTPPNDGLGIDAKYFRTINIRAGDYNLDGYPDLIATLTVTGAENRSVFFKNVPCSSLRCTYPRTFEPNFALLNRYDNVLSTTFYDSNENGLLDIMGVRRTSPNDTYTTFVVQNSPEYDSYFVRWIIISGACETNCPGYGVMLPGGTMKYTTVNANNQLQSSRASQVYRHGFALDLPGNLMGTGPSANFIDTIAFGGTLDGGSYNRTQIIPNSNLIAIPWRRPGGTYKWEMKHILRPKDGGILATFHVLLLICFLNASLVVFLHMRERKMDRLERSQDPVSMSALTMT